MIGGDRRQFGEGHHAQTLRLHQPWAKPAKRARRGRSTSPANRPLVGALSPEDPHGVPAGMGLRQHGRVLIVRATKKLLDRAGPPSPSDEESTTLLGQWYATALFWKPQVALFVNEPTLLPVLMP